jgi:gas vesicle structural protein
MTTDPQGEDAAPRPPEPPGPADDWEVWSPGADDDRMALVDLVNRVLDRGVVITGEVTISLAGVDLVYLGLNAVLTSVTTAREALGRPVGRHDGGAGEGA